MRETKGLLTSPVDNIKRVQIPSPPCVAIFKAQQMGSGFAKRQKEEAGRETGRFGPLARITNASPFWVARLLVRRSHLPPGHVRRVSQAWARSLARVAAAWVGVKTAYSTTTCPHIGGTLCLPPSFFILRVHSLGWPLMTLDFVGGARKLTLSIHHNSARPAGSDSALPASLLAL